MNKIEIKSCDDDEKKIEIYFGEDLFRRIDQSLFAKMDLYRFQHVSFEEFQSLYIEREKKVARLLAASFLAKKSFFVFELREKLLLKGIGKEACDDAIAFYEDMGALSDQTKLSLLIEKELRKGKSERAIRFFLRRYRIDQALIDQCFQTSGSSAKQSIESLLKGKLKKYSLQDPLQKRKVILFLQRRGFSLNDIFAALKEEE
jgi:regulatory protein